MVCKWANISMVGLPMGPLAGQWCKGLVHWHGGPIGRHGPPGHVQMS
jgi:hypothetical protein